MKKQTKTEKLIDIIEANGGLDMRHIEKTIRADGEIPTRGLALKYVTAAIKGYGYDRVARRAAKQLL